MRINYTDEHIDNLDVTALSATTINTITVSATTIEVQSIVISGGGVIDGDTGLAPEVQWTVVSTASELRAAIDVEKRNIFLKSGPTYNMTDQVDDKITLYSNLTMVGEALPTDQTNSKEDGVLIYNEDDEVIEYFPPRLSTGTVSCSARNRGDEFITIMNESASAIGSGDIITVDAFSYLVTDVVTVGVSEYNIYVRDDIQHNNASLAISIYYIPSAGVGRNITIDTVMLDDDDNRGQLEIRGLQNFKLKNLVSVRNNDNDIEIGYSVDVFVDNCHVARSGGDLALYSCNNFEMKNCGEHTKSLAEGVGDSNGIYVRYGISGSVSNSRGTTVSVSFSYNFRATNCHADSSYHYFRENHYFSVDGCSTISTGAFGFYCLNSTNFTITNCNAPNVSTTPVYLSGASDYRIHGNLWQGDTMKVKHIGVTSYPKHLPYIAQETDKNTKFLLNEDRTGVIIDTINIFPNGSTIPDYVMEFHGDRGYIYSNNPSLFASEDVGHKHYYVDTGADIIADNWTSFTTVATTANLPAPSGLDYYRAASVTATNTVWEVFADADLVGVWVDSGQTQAVWETQQVRMTINGYTNQYRYTLGDGQYLATRRSDDDWYRYGTNRLEYMDGTLPLSRLETTGTITATDASFDTITATDASFDTITATDASFDTIAEKFYDNGTVAESLTLDLNNGSYQSVNFSNSTSVSFSNVPTSGIGWSMTIDISQTGDYTITWPTEMRTAGGLTLTLTPSGTDIFVMSGHLGLSQFDGMVAGTNMI